MENSTDEELQQWLDEQDAIAAKREADLRTYRKLNPLPTWEHMKFNFQRDLYAKAIGLYAGY